MTWRDLLFCHWPVDPTVVDRTLPDRLSVATYEGSAYLGVVPFVMEGIRPRGFPTGLAFPELNLRTYVDGPVGRGVYFYNLDADDRLGVPVARRLFKLPYYRASMAVDRGDGIDDPQPGASASTDGVAVTEGTAEPSPACEPIRFRSRRTHRGAPPARFDASYRPIGESYQPESESLAAFLVENYQFYAEGRRLYYGRIEHEPWTLRDTTVSIRRNDLFEANGFDQPDGEPIVHYGEALPVTAGRLRRA